MLQFFNKLKDVTAKTESENAKRFRELVKRLAKGEEPSPAETLKVLQACGKSVDDLARAVESVNRRLELAETVRKGAQAARSLKSLQDKIDAADKKLAAAEEAHGKEIEPLTFEGLQLQAAVKAAEPAQAELEKSCTCPDVLAKIQEAHDAYSTKKTRAEQIQYKLLRDLADKISESEDILAKEGWGRQRHPADYEEHRERLARCKQQQSELQAELDGIVKELPTLEAAESAARLLALDPMAV